MLYVVITTVLLLNAALITWRFQNCNRGFIKMSIKLPFQIDGARIQPSVIFLWFLFVELRLSADGRTKTMPTFFGFMDFLIFQMNVATAPFIVIICSKMSYTDTTINLMSRPWSSTKQDQNPWHWKSVVQIHDVSMPFSCRSSVLPFLPRRNFVTLDELLRRDELFK